MSVTKTCTSGETTVVALWCGQTTKTSSDGSLLCYINISSEAQLEKSTPDTLEACLFHYSQMLKFLEQNYITPQ